MTKKKFKSLVRAVDSLAKAVAFIGGELRWIPDTHVDQTFINDRMDEVKVALLNAKLEMNMSADTEYPSPHSLMKRLERAILAGKLSDSQTQFAESVQKFYESSGLITVNQAEALLRLLEDDG